MPIASKINLELPEILYTYWEKIPIIQDVSSKVITKLSKNKAQGLVILSLSKGIEDQVSQTTKIRHAMSAIEIKDTMSEIYKFEINKSNLYYHIQKLIEQGVVKIVTSLQKSNIITSYYGRTSKLIFAEGNHDDAKSKKIKTDEETDKKTSIHKLIGSDQFIDLLQNFSQNASEINETKSLIEKAKKIRTEYHRDFMHWMIENEEKFRGLELNLLDVNFVYNQIKIYNDVMIALLRKLDNILKISI